MLWDIRGVWGAGEGGQHGLGGDVAGPLVLIGSAMRGFAFTALLLFAEQAVVGR